MERLRVGGWGGCLVSMGPFVMAMFMEHKLYVYTDPIGQLFCTVTHTHTHTLRDLYTFMVGKGGGHRLHMSHRTARLGEGERLCTCMYLYIPEVIWYISFTGT